jgi:hypothetical protein
MTARAIDLIRLICKECHRFWPRVTTCPLIEWVGLHSASKSPRQAATNAIQKHSSPSSLPFQSQSTIKFVPRSTLLPIPHITAVRIGKGGGWLPTSDVGSPLRRGRLSMTSYATLTLKAFAHGMPSQSWQWGSKCRQKCRWGTWRGEMPRVIV